jgi:hypothetical protein
MMQDSPLPATAQVASQQVWLGLEVKLDRLSLEFPKKNSFTGHRKEVPLDIGFLRYLLRMSSPQSYS